MKIKIINAKRSAIGKFGGSLSNQDTTLVCSNIIKQMLSESKIKKSDILYSVFGNVYSSGLGQGIARKIALQSGLPQTSIAYSVNMVCGSGMQAINQAFMHLKLHGGIALAGGFEFMSNVPYASLLNCRFSKKFGNLEMMDLLLNDGLIDSTLKIHMGKTAENIAKKYKISRQKQDEFAIFTKKRTIDAIKLKKFDNEICPIEVIDYKGKKSIFDTDEFTTDILEDKIKNLKPCFVKDGTGTVTAANSSGINDGAAFLLLATDDYCKKNHIKSNIEIVDCVSIGCEPSKMGLGPFYAIKQLLKQNKIKFVDIDLFEINEAFSAQILGCFELFKKEYNVTEKYLLSKTNLFGSGLGLGHPLGCSGARIVGALYHHMMRHKCKYGIASLCIGGGMGIAMLLKKNG